jgi:hypothetical protein
MSEDRTPTKIPRGVADGEWKLTRQKAVDLAIGSKIGSKKCDKMEVSEDGGSKD